MGKSVHNDVLDGAWNIIKNNCTKITLCSQEPTTYAQGNATYALADVTVESSDFTLADGDTSGRKVTVSQQTGVTVDSAGTATHIALLDVANSKLLYVTTMTSKVLDAGGDTVTIPAFDLEILDPS